MNSEEKVFAFHDVPHLLKLLRNHFLDTGVVYKKEIISPRTISDLLQNTNKRDISITFKVNDEHLRVKRAGTHNFHKKCCISY